MELERAAAIGGIAAAGVVIVLGFVPYLYGNPAAVNAYFTGAAVGPPMVGLFAVVQAVVFLAGLKGRSDPATVAGIAVVIGVFGTLIAWWWALSIEPSLAGGITQADAFRQHRWAFAVAATLLAVAAGGYGTAVLR